MITEQIRDKMKVMRKNGISDKKIAEIMKIPPSTVQYHLNPEQKQKQIERSVKNEKQRDRRKYMREYMSKRYKNDEEFKERLKKSNRDYQRRKYLEEKDGEGKEVVTKSS